MSEQEQMRQKFEKWFSRETSFSLKTDATGEYVNLTTHWAFKAFCANDTTANARLQAGMTLEAHARVRKTIDALCDGMDGWKARAEKAEADLGAAKARVRELEDRLHEIENAAADYLKRARAALSAPSQEKDNEKD
jgi:hypothetical protein